MAYHRWSYNCIIFSPKGYRVGAMSRDKKIQDYDPLYSFLRHYVDFALKLSYRTIRYVGRERVPTDGAVIYAPNHTNALMDALVILAMDAKAKVFVARADIFKNPTFARILTFLKIMPIMRMRDGYEEVKKNNETIERAACVLRDRVPFCIFPEGTHQTKYSSLPLSKGIFRIALSAQELMPDMPLYIVPVGLRYGNFFRFRSTVRVEVGEPINVGKFVAEHSELNSGEQINAMRDLLSGRMKQTIFYIPDDENYNATYEICATVVKQRVKHINDTQSGVKLRGLDAHFAANAHTVKYLSELQERDTERFNRLIKLGNAAHEMRHSKRISLSSVSVKYPVLSRILKGLFLLVALPYVLPVSLLTLPINCVCHLLFTKLKDYAFRNSVRYLVNLVMWPVLMIIYAIVAFVCLPWQWALLVVVALLPAPIIAHETYRLIRVLVSDIRLLMYPELRHTYEQIRQEIFPRKKH